MVQDKLEQVEKTLKIEEEAHRLTKQHAQEREKELENNVAEIARALAASQRLLEEKSNILFVVFLLFLTHLISSSSILLLFSRE